MRRQIGSCLVLLCILGCNAGFAQGDIRKLTKSEALNAAITKNQPAYPAVARQMRVEGVVELEAVVSEDGKVEKVNILSGNAMLTHPAADALKTWKFKAFVEDGKPVKVLAPVSFTFKVERD